MSAEINRFRAVLNARPELQTRILNGEDVITVAQEVGCTFTQGELDTFLDDIDELSEFELDAVSGAAKCPV